MRLTQITPFVPCTKLDDQIGFYRDTLGFTVGFQADNYAFLKRDNAAIRLVQVDAAIDLKNPERQGSLYIDVQDIDALYADMQPALSKLPKERVRAPFNQDYGQREFHVIDADCTLIFFGEAIT
jgi:catechol 2,3-dioxygenase-like lactoylglutathione lyase family enzyme